MCVLDEFSEYLLETRFNTSADFNTYPIRIFLIFFNCSLKMTQKDTLYGIRMWCNFKVITVSYQKNQKNFIQKKCFIIEIVKETKDALIC